jgi:hypothetical protein
MTKDDKPIIGDLWDVLNAIETVVSASDPAKREVLAQTIDAYADNYSEEYFWATRNASAGAPIPLTPYDRFRMSVTVAEPLRRASHRFDPP